ncbi:MAG: DUF1761 domain-containing protein [Hyphomicrobiaceae bacterium]
MAFAGISYLAVVVAAIASYVFGSVWYMALSKPWLAALGRTEAEIRGGGGPSPVPFVVAALAQVVMAYVLAGLIGHLGPGNVTPKNGMISALFVWAGFIATSLATNHAFQQSKRMLTLIDGGHWLGVLLIQGLVIGLFGT